MVVAVPGVPARRADYKLQRLGSNLSTEKPGQKKRIGEELSLIFIFYDFQSLPDYYTAPQRDLRKRLECAGCEPARSCQQLFYDRQPSQLRVTDTIADYLGL